MNSVFDSPCYKLVSLYSRHDANDFTRGTIAALALIRPEITDELPIGGFTQMASEMNFELVSAEVKAAINEELDTILEAVTTESNEAVASSKTNIDDLREFLSSTVLQSCATGLILGDVDYKEKVLLECGITEDKNVDMLLKIRSKNSNKTDLCFTVAEGQGYKASDSAIKTYLDNPSPEALSGVFDSIPMVGSHTASKAPVDALKLAETLESIVSSYTKPIHVDLSVLEDVVDAANDTLASLKKTDFVSLISSYQIESESGITPIIQNSSADEIIKVEVMALHTATTKYYAFLAEYLNALSIGTTSLLNKVNELN